MLTRFTDNIQYYTLLHAGSLPELKDALFPIIQQTQDIQAAWEEGEKYAAMVQQWYDDADVTLFPENLIEEVEEEVSEEDESVDDEEAVG